LSRCYQRHLLLVLPEQVLVQMLVGEAVRLAEAQVVAVLLLVVPQD
jgi:hypothetical protein